MDVFEKDYLHKNYFWKKSFKQRNGFKNVLIDRLRNKLIWFYYD